MKIKRWLRTQGSAIFTSPLYRGLRRNKAALVRRLRGEQAVVHYFHQADDPYSDLAVRALPHLAANYAIKLVPHLVPAPDTSAAPEPQRLMDWSLRDATQLAKALELNPLPWQKEPTATEVRQAQAALAGISDASEFTATAANIREAFTAGTESGNTGINLPATGDAVAALANGKILREKLGHYLGATFYFEGEWYWGLDRLPYLEQRLQPLARNKNIAPFVTRLEASVDPTTEPDVDPQLQNDQDINTDDSRPLLDLYFSFRSPYSWIVLPRVIALARLYNARLRLRFVLPMVMRGLPIPDAKRFYIVSDTKREAERVGLPFGLIADPVGKPTERGLAVLHHAIQDNKGEAFALSFMRGVFAEGINARSDAGLLKLCTRAGISAEQMQAALADPGWRAIAEANREEMFAQGIWGVPAFRVNEGSAHWGQDRLWLLEQLLGQRHTVSNSARKACPAFGTESSRL
jgi:2-hydroxychromene-2-carboxylate isomerase